MKIPSLRLPGIITSHELFRIATLCLYITLLLHAVLEAYTRGVLLADFGIVAITLPALLFFMSLARYNWPDTIVRGQSYLMLELGTAVCAILSLALPQTAQTPSLPWLIGLAGIFPLALERTLAQATTLAIALIGFALNIALGMQFVDWLPQVLATVFAGMSATFMANALDNNLVAVQQANLNERRFNEIARATRHAFLITDAHYRIKFANQALYEVIGYTQDEIARGVMPVLHPEDRRMHLSKLRYLRAHPRGVVLSRHRARHKDGHWVWLEARGHNLLHDTAIEGMVFSIKDISAREDAQRRLREEHALLRAVLDMNPSMIYATDRAGRFTISNRCFQRRFGYGSEDALRGKTIHDIVMPLAHHGRKSLARTMADRLHRQDLQVIETGAPLEDQELQGLWDNEQRSWHRVNKYPLRDAGGRIDGMLCIARDITDRKEYEMQLQHQALHDPLTGLPNRRSLLQRVADTMTKTNAGSRPLAMLFCDLDFFKSVNDIYGHDFGDKCLTETSRRIRAELPAADFVARFGGNEFIILSDTKVEEARIKAEALLKAISRQMAMDTSTVKIQASIGIALLDEAHRNPSDLIRDANAAMFQAKERGRNRAEIFDVALQSGALKRAQMDVALRFALERTELTPVYQPKVSILSGTVKGFELLLRWNNPQYGMISPVEFIPVAESSGLVVPIGLWVLEQACRQVRAWQDEYPQAQLFTVAVNVSMRQLLQSTFIDEVTAILDRTGVAPRMIELELTETSAMANPAQTIETLTRLKRLGLRLALDDFGTGYSSLAYLQKLPIDVIKIDKAFVQGLGRNRGNSEIVRLILALAQTLNLETVAEGVESQEDMSQLKKMGCYLAQGFVFSPPVSADRAGDLLRTARHFAVA